MNVYFVRVYGYVASDAEKLGYPCHEQYGITLVEVLARNKDAAKLELEEQGFTVLYAGKHSEEYK